MDLAELEMFNPDTGRMEGVRLSQAMFDFDFRSVQSVLCVRVHRKELPVSNKLGNAPFVFVVLLKVGAEEEAVVSSPFVVESKEAPPRAPKGPPKRIRAPSARLPFLAPADAEERAVNRLMGRRVRSRCAAAGAGDSPSPSPAPTPSSLPSLPSLPPVTLDQFDPFEDALLDLFDLSSVLE